MAHSDSLIIIANSNSVIGAGHAMRCLAIAEEWHNRNREVTLLYENNLDWVKDRYGKLGAHLREMKPLTPESYAEYILENKAGIVLVDSYEISEDTLNALIALESVIVVLMDDIAHRHQYSANIVINQNPYATTSLYFDKAHKNTQFLLGQQYALIRDEYLSRSWEQDLKHSDRKKKLLITLGGAGELRYHELLLESLIRNVCADQFECVYISPALVKAGVTVELPFLKILPSQSNFVEWMQWADMAISAAGASSWELFYAGIPSATCIIAENQIQNYHYIINHQLAFPLGDLQELSSIMDSSMKGFLEMSDEALSNMSANCKKVIDGDGRVRICDKMEEELKSL